MMRNWKVYPPNIKGANSRRIFNVEDCGCVDYIATVGGSDQEMEEIEENARLIAAAPDLLDALEDAVKWFSKLDDWSGVGDPNIEKYVDAIEKVKG